MILAAAPPSPLGAHQLLVFLVQLAVLLGAAFALGRLATRVRMPAVVGELAAGVVLGPSLLGPLWPALSRWLFPTDVTQIHLLDAVGQLGVLLLVGFTGMHLDVGLARRRGGAAAWVSAGGLLIPLGLGFAAGFALPAVMIGENADRPVFALFLGVAVCVSAIPVIAKVLLEMNLLHRDIGQLVVTAAAVDDVVGWSLLAVVSGMAGAGFTLGHVALSVGSLLVVGVVALVLGRPVVKGALTFANRSGEPGVAVAVVVLLTLVFAAGTHALELEPILGAFVCGLLLSASGLLDREKLTPLRTFVMVVLAPVFFATAGLRMDLTALRHPAVLGAAALVLVLAVVGKFVGAYLGARLGGLGHWEGLALGAGLNARGVIGVIVAMVGLRLGVLTTETYTIVVLVAVVTSLMAPPTLRYAVRRIAVTDEEREREKAFSG
ncbi:Kef-type K+ transport system membrane component KefB [Saccharothrix tamanrassetensis]|uniref:Kef-type K+ transport system membrane component KefB n=1 Tax=Saccharothrix tamanrassetensis TaxID=1051531 RepID=A0A841CP54_9PSEU|nr:cation:proton antiporter [Saccharothrix tamanrassetensis]MBB5958144.1 Kef-type K+ transport system membrane component KefB [Saccharothrix tamanrassetensis]